MADYSAHFHEKFKQNVLCAHEISWIATKFACTTYDILGILALILGTILNENICFSKYETAYFSALFHISLKKLYFYQIKETKYCMCT